jgi:hypothetical protein
VTSALQTEITEPNSVGDHVGTIGAPLGLESTVSEGIISATWTVNGTHIIQTTASISRGSSGGPLFNEYGKVIGLTTSEIREGQNLNFAVSARHIREMIARQRTMSLEEMLSETQVVNEIGGNTISIPARRFVFSSSSRANRVDYSRSHARWLPTYQTRRCNTSQNPATTRVLPCRRDQSSAKSRHHRALLDQPCPAAAFFVDERRPWGAGPVGLRFA